MTPSQRANVERLARENTHNGQRKFQLNWERPGIEPAKYLGEISALTCKGVVSAILCQLTLDESFQEPRLHYLMENLEQGVWDYNLKTNVFIASKAWHQLRGQATNHPIDMTNDDWLEDVHPDDRENLKNALDDQRTGKSKSLVIQYRHLHEKGHWVWIMCRASMVESDGSGQPLRIVDTDTDISEAMESQQAINQLASKLKLAVEASGMGIWEFNPVKKTVHWDDRMLEIYGITDGQNVRSDNLWEKHLHPDDYDDTVAYAEECKRLNKDFKRDYRIVRPSGQVCYIRSVARVVSVPNGASKLIGVNIDVTEDYEKAQELEAARAQLEFDALHDQLTVLGNRRALDQSAAMLFSRIKSDSRYAVMQIDLDHFKDVNDTLGHSAGDFVLSRVAKSLRRIVGTMGQPFRVGGDEFTILFEEAPEEKTLNAISEQIIENVSAPMEIEGQSCSVGASIGFAIGVGPPKSHSSIFIEADTALYAAKRAGRFTYRAYTDAIGKAFHLASNTRHDLKKALASGQFVCFFQPQYDARSLKIVGAEALIRWQCPKRGLLYPGQFLPSAIDAGLLDAIDHYIFNRVARLQTEWSKQGVMYPRISVNVSRARLDDANFLRQTREQLKDHHRFSFELLETTYYDNPDSELMFKLDALRDMGVQIEMDDFGTGHASVKALQALQPHTAKIDRSLVAPLGTYEHQLEILQKLSGIARLAGARVTVEGIENGTHMAAIRLLDCDALQGYALQRPMTELEFTTLLGGAGDHQPARSGAGAI